MKLVDKKYFPQQDKENTIKLSSFAWTRTSQAPTPPWNELVHISFSRTRPLKYLLHSLLLRTGIWATLRTVSSPVP